LGLATFPGNFKEIIDRLDVSLSKTLGNSNLCSYFWVLITNYFPSASTLGNYCSWKKFPGSFKEIIDRLDVSLSKTLGSSNLCCYFWVLITNYFHSAIDNYCSWKKFPGSFKEIIDRLDVSLSKTLENSNLCSY
jgi:hypothetical protein